MNILLFYVEFWGNQTEVRRSPANIGSIQPAVNRHVCVFRSGHLPTKRLVDVEIHGSMIDCLYNVSKQ